MSTLRKPGDLVAAGLAPPERLPELERVAARYALAITPDMAELIDPADPADPIARQLMPDAAELNATPEEDADPIGDFAHSPVEGIVHRYRDRVLLKPTHTCAVYCRFCFRREMVGPEGLSNLTAAQLDAAFAYIAERPEIWEVIVTGGDPFVLSPRRLADISARLAAIEHVKVVRYHTRVPVVDPGAVTDELVAAIKCEGKAVYVALHANHSRELTPAARAACARIIDAGLPMLSQTVLLKGVNDDPETLGALMRGFVENRIRPYYLHQGDLAPGTSHQRTSIAEGRAVMRALRGRFSGLCQPTYVLDIPGGHGKVPVGPNYVGETSVEDPNGVIHAYPPKRHD
ncbi:lysine-2,3-aminomutase-like protein [Phenylobacterium sp. 58.2.17]|uniref:lysine-2,3-aminomutase-like protein n=1 Tax=Phenylobacterium sp. 58.2.17 TaxID=2969306 RepID=UPI002264918D|nr:lysine-2,3-aminomutase-like protein [Phenylobacterium sp. 58.2.17]MCX7584791.1 lysine-2,3-aminomutase-like protein [Phenylobacterium sp. 58.2.17]